METPWDIIDQLEKIYVHRKGYQGKTYQGPQCRIILRNIVKLNIPDELSEFVTCLKALRDLNVMASRKVLPLNYAEVIHHFTDSYNVLVDTFGITTPNKVHLIMDHLEEYYDHTKKSLRDCCDELIEAMHQFVKKRMENSNYIVSDIQNPNHGLKLHRTVLHINGFNFI